MGVALPYASTTGIRAAKTAIRMLHLSIVHWIAYGLLTYGLLTHGFLMGCASIESLTERPEASFEGVQLQEVTLTQASLLFILKIENPNPFNLSIRQVDYNLSVNNTELITGKIDESLKVPAGGHSLIQIPVDLRYLDAFGSLAEMANASQTPYLLQGVVTIGQFRVPFSYEGTLDLPNPTAFHRR